MAVIRTTDEDDLRMLMVGNCLNFNPITNVRHMMYQTPGEFEAIQKGYFSQRARSNKIRLAKKVIDGQRFHPTNLLLLFLSQPENVPHNGAISPMWTPVSLTAFFNQIREIAPKYTKEDKNVLHV